MNFRLIRRRFLFCAALALAGTMRLSGAAAADTEPAPASSTPPPPAVPPAGDRMAPPEIVKPIVPNRAELPDVAFKKLDAANKGYVTLEDVRGLDGFDKAFAAVDTKHTGQLDFAQFKKAWAMYSGYK